MRYRLLITVLLAMIVICSPARATTFWSDGFESGDLTGWSSDGGGGEFNSDGGDTIVQAVGPHVGTYAAKQSLDADGAGGTRMFRWKEMRENRVTTTSVWMKLSNTYTLNGPSGMFMNLFQIKSRSTGGANDPIWYLDNRGNRLDLIWWCGFTRPCTLAGPHAGEDGFKRYTSGTSGCDLSDCTAKALPSPGTWFQLKMVVKQSNGFDGFVRFYQSSTKIFGLEGVRTSYPNCVYNAWCAANEWSANMYTDGATPVPYNRIDDALTTIP